MLKVDKTSTEWMVAKCPGVSDAGRVVRVSGGVMSDRPGGAMQVWPVIKWTGVCTLHNNGMWIIV